MLLTKEDILKVEDLDYEEVEVPEWGGTVRIRCLTAAERDSFEASIYEIRGTGDPRLIRENFRANLVARTLVDEKGNRLFSDKEIALLGKKNAKALNRLFGIAQRLNALTKEDEDEFIKNLGGEEADTSTSSSPKSSA